MEGEKYKTKKDGNWVLVFLVSYKPFTWAEICECNRERREREILVWFSFHAYNYLGKPPFTFFLFLAIPFSLGKSCVTGQCNRQLFGSAFVNCQQPFFKTFLKLPSLSLSLLCLLLILCICIWGESINTKNDKPIGH